MTPCAALTDVSLDDRMLILFWIPILLSVFCLSFCNLMITR